MQIQNGDSTSGIKKSGLQFGISLISYNNSFDRSEIDVRNFGCLHLLIMKR